MSFTSHLIALAAGVAGVTLYQRARESGAMSMGNGGGASAGSGMSSGMSGASGGSDPAGSNMMSGSLEGADSPNTGERISTQGVGQGPLSSDAPDGLSADNLFGSDSQTGSQARTPGMADLTRGA